MTPESVEIDFGPNKERMTLTTQPTYTGPVNIGDKFPMIARIFTEKPLNYELAEVVEMSNGGLRFRVCDQIVVCAEEMFRYLIEEFPEDHIGADLTL